MSVLCFSIDGLLFNRIQSMLPYSKLFFQINFYSNVCFPNFDVLPSILCNYFIVFAIPVCFPFFFLFLCDNIKKYDIYLLFLRDENLVVYFNTYYFFLQIFISIAFLKKKKYFITYNFIFWKDYLLFF